MMDGSIVSLCKLNKVAVTNTSATLAELLAVVGSGIESKLKNLVLYNYGDQVVYMNDKSDYSTTIGF